ncbi:NAD(P)/FAD-dependent oxidoreductase [Kribbella yunnanensis]|uniref:NAD(P)/FAD-dependent oxidoreductase n=1 Tax=Kribbella yunnanensis TaxID=190194 RepID=A0ABP4U4B2_9ACTN
MRVMVVGAGLGGLTLAQGLRRAGIDVAVYERDGADGRPQGVSLHFDDRGAAALRACLPPAHLAIAEATMGAPRGQALALSEVDGELVVVGNRVLDGTAGRVPPGRQVSRRLLRAVLLAGLEDVVRFGAKFTHFEQRPDGTVQAWFADGSTDTADVLVGADGIGSGVRWQYLPQVQVYDTGKRMLMGASPLRAVADTGVPELIGDNPASAQIGTTMMAMGALRFQESPRAARDQWLPDLRSSAIDDAEDFLMWAVPVTQERLGAAATPAAIWRRTREVAADLPAVLRAVVDHAWPDLTVALRIGMIPPVPAWPSSQVTVIGDAIHAAPGFGGNLAMQDAHLLRDALVEVAQGRSEVRTAISEFEDAVRRNNAPALEPHP